MVKAQNIPLEQAAFQEAWELLKEAYDMQDIDANWELLLSRAEAFEEQFSGTIVSELSAELAVSVMHHIEIVKQMEKKGGITYA